MLNRVPSPWLAYPGPDTYRSPEEVVEGRGIARGTHGCVHQLANYSYLALGIKLMMAEFI